MKHYNESIYALLNNEQHYGVELILKNIPIEFRHSVNNVYESVVSREVAELQRERTHIAERNLIFKQMAHDIASPLSVLEMVTKAPGPFNDEKQQLLTLATLRVKEIAREIMVQESNSKQEFQHISRKKSVKLSAILNVIENIVLEKTLEHKGFCDAFSLETDLVPMINPDVIVELSDFGRIVSNILNNSIQALESISKPQITILITQRLDSINLKISDNGNGFAESLLSSNFSVPFTYNKADGHGLGLFNAYRLVKIWGGQMSICNSNGASVQISLRIPND